MSKKSYFRAAGKKFEVMNVYTSKQKAEINVRSVFYFIFIIAIVLLGYFTFGKYWSISIHVAESMVEHYLFSLMFFALFGGFLMACLNSEGISDYRLKLIAVIFVIVIGILGIENFGLSIWLNFDFLRYKTLTTNSIDSLQFMIQNIDFLLIVYGTTFLAESNK